MQACLIQVAAEAIRATLAPVATGAPENNLWLTLSPVPGAYRTKGAARYTVAVRASWLGEPWASGVSLVDVRGNLLLWQLSNAATWLLKALSGAPCVVHITIDNAAGYPPHWTQARKESAAAKVAALSGAVLRDGAAAKTAGVAAWSASERKTAVLESAVRMLEAAALLDAVRAGLVPVA